MHKITNLIMQTVSYFLIVLFLFWIMHLIGINRDSSIIILSIGSTIGWGIFRVGSIIIEKHKRKKIENT